jgi:hypothetical protein
LAIVPYPFCLVEHRDKGKEATLEDPRKADAPSKMARLAVDSLMKRELETYPAH